MSTKTWTDFAVNDAGTIGICVCSNDGTTNKTTNGTTFAAAGSLGSAGAASKVIYWLQTAGLFVVLEHNTTRSWTSTDGTTWSAVTLPFKHHATGVNPTRTVGAATTGALFVASGGYQAINDTLWKTTDGATWSQIGNSITFVKTGTEANGLKILRIGASMIAVSTLYGTSTWVTKDDGVTWTLWTVATSSNTSPAQNITQGAIVVSSTRFVCGVFDEAGLDTTKLAYVDLDSTKAQLSRSLGMTQYIRYA
jgi:hypothetical protein